MKGVKKGRSKKIKENEVKSNTCTGPRLVSSHDEPQNAQASNVNKHVLFYRVVAPGGG